MAQVGMPRKFVFVCVNKRPEDHPRGCCIDRGSGEVFTALREETGRQGLIDVKIVLTGCMEPCMVGPTVLVVPDNVWYGGVTVDDVPLLVEQHLLGDEPVEWLRISEEEFELSPEEGPEGLDPGLLTETEL